MTREQELEAALKKIWDAYCVFVSNGGGSWKRHVEAAICDAKKLLPK